MFIQNTVSSGCVLFQKKNNQKCNLIIDFCQFKSLKNEKSTECCMLHANDICSYRSLKTAVFELSHIVFFNKLSHNFQTSYN